MHSILDFIRKRNAHIFVLMLYLVYSSGICSNNKPDCKCKHAITYAPHSGRFGDQICGYSRTKWLSYKYNIPFIFNPVVPGHPEMLTIFQELTMFHAEKHASKELIESIQKRQIIKNEKSYSNVFVVENEKALALALKKKTVPTLFICSYGTKLDLTNSTMFKNKIAYTKQNVDLLTYLISLEETFGTELKMMLSPASLSAQALLKDRITVAVHLRTGGGYDKIPIYQQYFESKKYHTTYNIIQIDGKKIKFDVHNSMAPAHESAVDANDLLRFLPKQYYVDQIIKLSNLLDNAPLYVYLFTDEKNTTALVDEFRKKVNLPNIEWDFRSSGNAYFRNIVEDFYLMSQFDCLVRPRSNFSLGASLLGNHKIIIEPKHGRRIKKDILLIDEVDIVYRDDISNRINSINNKVIL